jgi:hypothetical protein
MDGQTGRRRGMEPGRRQGWVGRYEHRLDQRHGGPAAAKPCAYITTGTAQLVRRWKVLPTISHWFVNVAVNPAGAQAQPLLPMDWRLSIQPLRTPAQ